MSTFHFTHRRLRRTAGVTLVVWLLALAAGVVNACALGPAGPERVGLHAEVPSHEQHRDDGERPGHHHGSDSGQKSCLKFCDDESSAVVKVKLPAVDGSAVFAVLAQPWQPIAATGSKGWGLSSQRPGSQGPPLVIRFLRLTL